MMNNNLINMNMMDNNLNNMNMMDNNLNNMNMMNNNLNNMNMMNNNFNNMNMIEFNNNINIMNNEPMKLPIHLFNRRYIEINFESNLGSKKSIKINKNKTIKKLFYDYISEIGYGEEFFNFIDKDIFFFYNGKKLNYKSKEKLENIFFNNSTIKIIDNKGIINETITAKFINNFGTEIKKIKANLNNTFKNLLKIFVEHFGLREDIIGKDLFFYNNSYADSMVEISDTRNINLKIKNFIGFSGTISVIDNKGILSETKLFSFDLRGEKYTISVSSHIKVKDLLNVFKKKCVFEELDVIFTKLNFYCNALKIDQNSQETLKSFFPKVNAFILINVTESL